jgi:hypothetical protein
MQTNLSMKDLPPHTPVLFAEGVFLTHLKTGGQYQIKDTPDQNRLEHNALPAYGYLSLQDGLKWQRNQADMEDGRFVPTDEVKQNT